MRRLVLLAALAALSPAVSAEVLLRRAASDGAVLSIEDCMSKKYAPLKMDAAKKAEKPRWTLPVPEREGIVYGETVSRNEFGLKDWVVPSPDGKLLAVYRKDESAVGTFPLLDISSRTGGASVIRYPMAGMASEKLQLCICDMAGHILARIIPSEFSDERYLTGVTWSPDSRLLYVNVLDREQHHSVLNCYSAADGSFVKTLLTEENDAWVEPYAPLHFLSDGRFIYSTDNRDGWKNLYLCDTDGGISRLTRLSADVEYVSHDDDYVYYTAAAPTPVEKNLYRLHLPAGKNSSRRRVLYYPVRLTEEPGVHEITALPGSRFQDCWTGFDNAGATVVRDNEGEVVETLLSNPGDPMDGILCGEIEFGTVKAADGETDNYYRFIRPANFDPSRKYPLLVYVYGGPHSQLVKEKWLGGATKWEIAMAQRGFAVYVQDNSGTANRGAAFEKAINRRCGRIESNDQFAGIDALLEREPWIDRGRIGIHGWSYGGFMTITMMTRRPSFFKVGVAGGPVIDWKWYEVMYGERYMDRPDTNPEGFESTSLLGKTSELKGKLLICQGVMDDTVLPQHALNFVLKCVNEGVRLEYFPYPASRHNMRGAARVHLYEKITDYFVNWL